MPPARDYRHTLLLLLLFLRTHCIMVFEVSLTSASVVRLPSCMAISIHGCLPAHSIFGLPSLCLCVIVGTSRPGGCVSRGRDLFFLPTGRSWNTFVSRGIKIRPLRPIFASLSPPYAMCVYPLFSDRPPWQRNGHIAPHSRSTVTSRFVDTLLLRWFTPCQENVALNGWLE